MNKYELYVGEEISYNDIVFKCKKGLKDYPEEIEELIEKTWLEKKQSSDEHYLYDGTVFSLLDYSYDEHKLYCEIQKTSYKAFIGTNVENIAKITDKNSLANAIAACVVPITTDNYILVGKRNDKLAEGGAEWHIVGGTMEGFMQNGVIMPENPYDLIYKELEEEISVGLDDIKTLTCIGFGRSLRNHKPEFLFVSYLTMTANELALMLSAMSQGKIEEHTKFIFIKINELIDFMKRNKFSPIGELAIETFLKRL